MKTSYWEYGRGSLGWISLILVQPELYLFWRKGCDCVLNNTYYIDHP